MTAATYPYGYSGTPAGMGQMLTLDQLLTKTTVIRMHPEVQRRVFALMRCCTAHGFPLGIGTAYRSYAQQEALHKANPNGSAAPGNSNHEGNNSTDDRDAIAADMVPETSWTFMRGVLRQFGLICFMSSPNPADWSKANGRSYSTGSVQEPWHIQPTEVLYARSGRTTRVILPSWPIDPVWLSDNPTPPSPPTPDPQPPTPPPAPQEDLMPINVNKPAYDSRIVDGPFQQGTGRNIPIPDAKGHKWAELGLVAVEANGGGFFAISNTGVKPATAALNVEPGGMISGQRSGMFFLNGDGAVDVYFDSGGVDGVSCHLVIDVAVVGD